MKSATLNKLNHFWKVLEKVNTQTDLEELSYVYDYTISFLFGNSELGSELSEVVSFMMNVNNNKLRYSGVNGTSWKITTHGFLLNALTGQPKWNQIK
jgi:predicted acetyltransferase